MNMNTDDESIPLPQRIANRDRPRLTAYKSNLDFYGGQQWDRPQRRRPRTLPQLTFNYAATLINKLSSYVMAGLTIGVEPLSESPEHIEAAAKAEEVLTQISDENNLPRLDFDNEIDTAVLGDGAFKVLWNPNEERVTITAPDMQGLYVWPHPARFDRARQIAHTYQLSAADIRALWNYQPLRDPAQVIEDWTDTTLDIWVDKVRVATSVNPYNAIPIIIYPNLSVPKQWHGISDLEQAKEPAKQINAQLSRISAILELSGSPITVLENVEQASDIQAEPGAVWDLPEKAKAYLLDLLSGGGVRLHIDYLESLLETLYAVTETPRTAFGSTERDLSGIALQVQLQPLLQKCERKRLIRTDAYKRRALLALQIYDQHHDTTHATTGRVTIAWAAPSIYDRAAEIRNESAQIAAGLSTRKTSMSRLGEHDPDARYQEALQEARDWAQVPPAPDLTKNVPSA